MNMETAKKYLPEGKSHVTEKQFSDEELAVLIDSLFFKENEKIEFPNEKSEATHYLLKKEVAYQTIRRLAGEKRLLPAVIQDEKDWKRYFRLEIQERRCRAVVLRVNEGGVQGYRKEVYDKEELKKTVLELCDENVEEIFIKKTESLVPIPAFVKEAERMLGCRAVEKTHVRVIIKNGEEFPEIRTEIVKTLRRLRRLYKKISYEVISKNRKEETKSMEERIAALEAQIKKLEEEVKDIMEIVCNAVYVEANEEEERR